LIPWINLAALVASTALFTWFYVRSVSPAVRSRTEGDIAYERCASDRVVSGVFEAISFITYIVYVWFPLPIGLPVRLPWAYGFSAVLAAAIGIPAVWLMVRGLRDAGEETLRPKPEHSMYGGIYRRIRHPQAAGEFPIYFVAALLCHSPFLLLYSLVWIPVYYVICRAEERDLLIRYGDAYAEYMSRTGFWWPK